MRQIEGFGEYGFPESHAASFANLVYASAWIKCLYPDVFAAALLNSQPMGFYATAQIVRDAQEHGVDVRPADINFSDWDSHWNLEPSPREVGLRSEPGRRQISAAIRYGTPTRSAARTDLPLAGEVKGRLHPRHANMRDDIRTTHALRLGLRQISGLSEAHGRKIIETVRGEGFDSVRDLWLRTGQSRRARKACARRCLSLARPRPARCAMGGAGAAAQRRQGRSAAARARAMQELEPDAALPPMRPGQHVIEDYRPLHLSLKAHPLSFLRTELAARGILRHERLPTIAPADA